MSLRIGFVPEHFSTPLHYAKAHYALNAELVAFPAGTGHMITALRNNELDVAIGLSEGFVNGLGKKRLDDGSLATGHGYVLVGTYVSTPLRWAVSCGTHREDLSSIKDLKSSSIGVSRIGSGSHVMGAVLADQQGWLNTGARPFKIVPLENFANLRDGVNRGNADFFMWEHFTSKKYHDNGSIKRIGEIYTPWPSWLIVSRDGHDERLPAFFEALDKGVAEFEANPKQNVDFISTNLDYSVQDATEWLSTVKFAKGTKGVEKDMVCKTIEVLGKAGIIVTEGKSDTIAQAEQMLHN